VAKQLFIILIFGGSVNTWKKEHNISVDTALPAICQEVYANIDARKREFMAAAESVKYIQVAKIKSSATGKPWENTALAL
jgi:hypothetical protein